jgi:integrase
MRTVAQLLSLFDLQLEHDRSSGVCTSSTVEWYRSQLKKLGPVNDRVAVELKPFELPAKLTHHFARAVKRLYSWAKENELIESDPMAKVKTPRCGARNRVLTSVEFRSMLRASQPRFRRFLIALSRTIARPGELRTLRWEQVDFGREVLVLHDFKSKELRRDRVQARYIPLDHCALKLFAWLKRHRVSEYVFTSREGHEFTANALRCQMRALRKRAHLSERHGEKIVCYHLRHTAATKANRNGVGLKHLALLMGHTRVTTTERYTHLDLDDLKKSIAQATK